MNKVFLIGRITKDVDLRKTSTEKSVASFTMAVNRDFKNAEGNYDADFINCVAYDKRAETISKYVHKGDRFGIFGKLNTRNYENKDGAKVYVTEVIVEGFEFLEGKKNTTHDENVSADFIEVESTTDELPF